MIWFIGSRVSVELCIKDLVFEDSLANNKSENYTYFAHIFVKELRKYMLELKDQKGMYVFRRMEMPTFTNLSGATVTQLNTLVDMTLIHNLAAYYVTMALDLNIGVTHRLAGYKTAVENCLFVVVLAVIRFHMRSDCKPRCSARIAQVRDTRRCFSSGMTPRHLEGVAKRLFPELHLNGFGS
ncbi:hypothetical protein E2C01_053971 [Portunus trituberculatus]|uniref:Uncharacterized protein n=1 Tax=Portunus trituberculatus TaxID=210409 RepID=A0A5B7GQT6_PORTR|nr:hypothetical protein [Portunus trituberculatus]